VYVRRRGHGRVEHQRYVLIPVPVGRPQHHDSVSDGGAVQVVQSDRIGTRQGQGISARCGLHIHTTRHRADYISRIYKCDMAKGKVVITLFNMICLRCGGSRGGSLVYCIYIYVYMYYY
jgi:hypothetical protein